EMAAAGVFHLGIGLKVLRFAGRGGSISSDVQVRALLFYLRGYSDSSADELVTVLRDVRT
ncbi:hypothetical protein BHE74_00019887, partial [Ensete ventricosum]